MMKRAFSLMLVMSWFGCEQPKKETPEPPAKTEKGVETFGLSDTTMQIFKQEGLRKLQEKLNTELKEVGEDLDGGLPDAGGSRPKNEPPKSLEVNGKLDESTQRALGAWQKTHGMPETGLPDYETLMKLGFEPDDVYFRRPPATRGRDERDTSAK